MSKHGERAVTSEREGGRATVTCQEAKSIKEKLGDTAKQLAPRMSKALERLDDWSRVLLVHYYRLERHFPHTMSPPVFDSEEEHDRAVREARRRFSEVLQQELEKEKARRSDLEPALDIVMGRTRVEL